MNAAERLSEFFIYLILLCIFIYISGFMWSYIIKPKIQNKTRYEEITTFPRLSSLEIAILQYANKLGYTHIEPRKLINYENTIVFHYDGVRIFSKNLDKQDLILDTPFHLFEMIQSESSIEDLIKQ